jgi:hypothetical protein
MATEISHADHDPLIDYPTCSACYVALSAAFVKLADLYLGPKDTDNLIARLRDLADAVEVGP